MAVARCSGGKRKNDKSCDETVIGERINESISA
jgi:hypothetical protein